MNLSKQLHGINQLRNKMSKEKTEDEIRTEFLNRIRAYVTEWDSNPLRTSKEKLNGLAFSILAMLDGVDPLICGFIVAPSTHEDDKQYNIDNGDDYYPQNHESDVKCDIAGGLHDLFYQKEETA